MEIYCAECQWMLEPVSLSGFLFRLFCSNCRSMIIVDVSTMISGNPVCVTRKLDPEEFFAIKNIAYNKNPEKNEGWPTVKTSLLPVVKEKNRRHQQSIATLISKYYRRTYRIKGSA